MIRRKITTKMIINMSHVVFLSSDCDTTELDASKLLILLKTVGKWKYVNRKRKTVRHMLIEINTMSSKIWSSVEMQISVCRTKFNIFIKTQW
jgi:hypothetical protein